MNNNASSPELNGDTMNDAIAISISSDAPDIYGQELDVSFNEVERSMAILQQFDPGYGSRKINLSPTELTRYTDIGLRISCEYCCSAASIVFKDGSAACGCAHSQAMRGLAAYLLSQHKDEYSNDEILRELARWKGMFFPKQMIEKTAKQLANGSFTADIAALALGKSLPQYGNRRSNAPLPSSIQNLPGMVGGC
jgi:hypothetical protein